MDETRGTKRKQNNEAGDSTVSSSTRPQSHTLAPVPSRGQALAGSPDLPTVWVKRVNAMPVIAAIPPASVIVRFRELYDNSLKSFRGALKHLHKTTAARARFESETEGDNIPNHIAGTLKGPVFQFVKDYSALALEELHDHREEYLKAMSDAQKAAIKYTRACHEKNVECARQASDAGLRAEALAVDMQSLGLRLSPTPALMMQISGLPIFRQ